jgi:hypothetical protein
MLVQRKHRLKVLKLVFHRLDRLAMEPNLELRRIVRGMN